jgi:hypothetical protein
MKVSENNNRKSGDAGTVGGASGYISNPNMEED